MTTRALPLRGGQIWRLAWLPVTITLCLHALLLFLLSFNWASRAVTGFKPRPLPRYVEASLIDLQSLRQPRPPKAAASPPPKAAASPPPPRAAPATPAPVVTAPSRPEPAVAPDPVAPAPKPTAAQRAAVARAALARALAVEDALLEQDSDRQLAQSYMALIAQVIEDNWSRPPSARNEMEAELVLQLIPTGEVVSVAVTRSSGLLAFDRSAVMAVRKAERFPELQRLPARLFEQNFRRLRLKFKPEDLRY